MDLVPIIVVCAAVGVATITDIRWLKVFNWLTLPLLLSGLIFHGVQSGWDGFGLAVFNVVVVFLILMVPYVLGAIGAGDLKLVAALGAWLGPAMTFTITATALFASGFFALGLLARQRRLTDAWWGFKLSLMRMSMVARHMGNEGETVHEMAATPEGRARLIPFSVMIAIGTVTTIVWQTCVG
jgi:prepilin peptidase CpaA